ncbi:hypothetical protein ACFL26_02425 [Patescibacteria group bacterium]
MIFRPEDAEIDSMVMKLRQTRTLVFAATTGAAGRLRQDLWAAEGCSANTVGDVFTYDYAETDEFLGFQPTQGYCNDEAARQLAARAYTRARARADRGNESRPVLGLGMTATVATGRVIKGGHRVHIAVRTDERFYFTFARFSPGVLTRRQEGEACDLLALDAILQVTDCGEIPTPHASIERLVVGPASTLAETYGQQGDAFLYLPDGTPWRLFGSVGRDDLLQMLAEHGITPANHVIYPGSFNPVHYGHEEAALQMEGLYKEDDLKRRVLFQISGAHPVKDDTPPEELQRRAEQFRYRAPLLILPEAGLYVEKARLLPGFSFLLGSDAVRGLLNPRHYGGWPERNAVLDELAGMGTRFYVSGREIDGVFTTLDMIDMPPKYAHLFTHVSTNNAISSSEIRNRGDR